MDLRFANCIEKKLVVLCLLFFRCGGSANVDPVKEKTLAMVKPDGVDGKYVDVIKKTIWDSGFSIVQETELRLEENAVKGFYKEHSSKNFFSSLVQYMTSGPVLVMVLEKENAVTDWRALIGPTDASRAKATHPRSVRALCGVDSQRNCVHGSDSPQSAAREISFFFDKSSSGQVISGANGKLQNLPFEALCRGMMNYRVVSACKRIWMAFDLLSSCVIAGLPTLTPPCAYLFIM